MDRKNPLLTRRQFLGLVESMGIGVMVVGVAGSLYRSEPEFSFTRPPGARDEETFLALCQRCDICRLSCPYDIIRPIRLDESRILVGTPVLQGHCRNCANQCKRHCPTGALI